MPLARVKTTATCSSNMLLGNHVYNPSEDREIDLTDDEYSALKQAAGGAELGHMFAEVSKAGELAATQAAAFVPAAESAPKPKSK